MNDTVVLPGAESIIWQYQDYSVCQQARRRICLTYSPPLQEAKFFWLHAVAAENSRDEIDFDIN